MKYLPLIWFGIWRKPMRATLILLQVAVAFALFGVLQGMKSGVEQIVANVRADVLLVGQSLESASPLPVSYIDRLRSIAGVKAASFTNGLAGAIYQKPTQRVAVIALESNDVWQTVLPSLYRNIAMVSPKDLHALQNTRTGALIMSAAGKKYGWRVGDRIPITSTTLQNNGSGNWVFDIVGVLPSAEGKSAGLSRDNDVIFINYDYLDEARALNKGTANFIVVISDPRQAAAASDTIDRTFANSSSETTTQPLRVLAQQVLQRIGDLNFLIRSIVSAVLAALMFSIATMMMQTVRERTPELAVMKALGFSDRVLFVLVVVEAVMLCTAGALIGLALATRVFPFAARFVPGLSMPRVVLAFGLIGAVLISLISVSLPASRAARLQVVDGLAGR